jgi:hypothetical protein
MKYPVLFIAVLLIMAALIAGCTQQAASQQNTYGLRDTGCHQGWCHCIADRPCKQCRYQHVAVGPGCC